MNDENLITFDKLTPRERTEISRKGAIASNKVQKQKKMMREVAMKDVESAKSVDGLEDVWKSNILLHTDNEFKNAVKKKKAELL